MLTDGEMAIVLNFAEAISQPRREAFLQSVETMLGQCAPPRNADIVHKLAAEEARRFLHPPKRRQGHSVRLTGHV